MTVSINTRTWVEVSEVISSKTSNKATLDPTQLVTDHYLLDHHTGGKPRQWDDGPANKV